MNYVLWYFMLLLIDLASFLLIVPLGVKHYFNEYFGHLAFSVTCFATTLWLTMASTFISCPICYWSVIGVFFSERVLYVLPSLHEFAWSCLAKLGQLLSRTQSGFLMPLLGLMKMRLLPAMPTRRVEKLNLHGGWSPLQTEWKLCLSMTYYQNSIYHILSTASGKQPQRTVKFKERGRRSWLLMETVTKNMEPCLKSHK